MCTVYIPWYNPVRMTFCIEEYLHARVILID